ncbi:hypothetical protein HJ588_07885 [Flexivirga sp. ID2601S]|uniref:Uncharacterized protein n=1 Tax=Flexivirga aerilata TaxID=1656889 RepID=A0A849AGZ2_9MICO|nr:hypothetical protein [Flexivirga aerilata]NNG39193.1 hypothetical protein [Flexivirga aerilata]
MMPLLCETRAAMTPALLATPALKPARAGFEGTALFATNASNGIGGQFIVRDRALAFGARITGEVSVQVIDGDVPTYHNSKFAGGVSRSAVGRPPV